MWGWVYGLFKALFETALGSIVNAKPKSVATDPGTPGSVAGFLQRLRARRDSGSSPDSNKDSDSGS